MQSINVAVLNPAFFFFRDSPLSLALAIVTPADWSSPESAYLLARARGTGRVRRAFGSMHR